MSQAQVHTSLERHPAPSIFIVEDEVLVAKDIQKSLLELGYRVLGRASNGTAALLKATQLKPDLILMDIGLPGGVDGVATAAAIRAQTSIPVVFLSGLLDRETLDRAGGSDPFGFLIKPFKPAALRGAIEIALRRCGAETAARARERLLLTTLHAIGDGLITTDERGTISFVNPVAERLTGWTLTGALGRQLDEVLQLRDESTGQPVDSAQQAIIQRGLTRSPKGTLLVGRQRTLAIDSSSAPVLGEEGQVLGSVSVFRDTSDQQRLEGQLRGYQKMAVVGHLTSAIAHDFNNILSAILLCSRFLVESFDKDDPRRGDLEQIEKSGSRGAALTRQLLTFGRRQALDATPLNLNEVVTDLEQMLRLISGLVELSFDGAADLGLITIDRGQIERVLVNLVVNARDAMPAGGTLGIATSNVFLELADVSVLQNLRPGHHVMLTVTDTGCGMDSETQARVFEAFFSTKDQSQGAGLGLSASHEIITQNGGHIGLSSELGRGTTFTVYLPRTEGRSNSYTRELSARLDSDAAETILLIEKDSSLRENVARTLELFGYRVLRAADQQEASRAVDCHEGAIDLLLRDQISLRSKDLPLPAGLESRCADTPVLVMLGYADDAPEHVDPALNVIRRPFVSDSLARKVRTVIDSSATVARPPERVGDEVQGPVAARG